MSTSALHVYFAYSPPISSSELFVSGNRKIEAYLQGQYSDNQPHSIDQGLREVFRKLDSPRPNGTAGSKEMAVRSGLSTSGPDVLDPTFVLARLHEVLSNESRRPWTPQLLLEADAIDTSVQSPTPESAELLLKQEDEENYREIQMKIKDLVTEFRRRLQSNGEFGPEQVQELSELAERAAELLGLPQHVTTDGSYDHTQTTQPSNPAGCPLEFENPVEIDGVGRLTQPTRCTLSISEEPEWISLRAKINGTSQTFRHDFRRAERPFPHTIHPGNNADPGARCFVSFLSQQLVCEEVSAAASRPSATLQYHFHSQTDRIRFQEALLDQTHLMSPSIKKISSPEKGYSCETVQLRLFQDKNGRKNLIYFANSEDKKNRKYRLVTCMSLPLNQI